VFLAFYVPVCPPVWHSTNCPSLCRPLGKVLPQWRDKPESQWLTAKDWGLAVISAKLLKEVFQAIQEGNFGSQCLVRETFTSPQIISGDHHKKRFYGSQSGDEGSVANRLTFWDNVLNLPILAINTHTTSFDEATVVEGCNAVNAVIKENGGSGPELAYSDMPQRDGPGFMRRFPSLKCTDGRDAAVAFHFTGEIKYITKVDDVAAATAVLSAHRVLGLDLEFYAPMTRGQPNHPTALIQLCTGDSPGVCYLFDVHKMKCLPQELKDIICSSGILKVGNNINGDATKLGKDFGNDVKERLIASCRDIGSLANEKLPLLTTSLGTRRWNLEDLVKEVRTF
jgi:hypothetical protein